MIPPFNINQWIEKLSQKPLEELNRFALGLSFGVGVVSIGLILLSLSIWYSQGSS